VVSENEKLRRENQRLARRLQQAEIIIDVQKKVSEMLAVSPEELRPLKNPDDEGSE
jgi:transposase